MLKSEGADYSICHVASLGPGMSKGHLSRLEELVVNARATGLIPIISALGEGACPAICKLHLDDCKLPDGLWVLQLEELLSQVTA